MPTRPVGRTWEWRLGDLGRRRVLRRRAVRVVPPLFRVRLERPVQRQGESRSPVPQLELALWFQPLRHRLGQCCRVLDRSTKMESCTPATGWLRSTRRRRKKNGALQEAGVSAEER